MWVEPHDLKDIRWKADNTPTHQEERLHQDSILGLHPSKCASFVCSVAVTQPGKARPSQWVGLVLLVGSL